MGNKLWVVPKHLSGFPGFKAGRTSTDDDERSGRPVSSSTPEMIERVRQIIREDRRRTIDEVSMLVGPDQWRNNTMLLHHDNAPAHAALLTRRFLTANNMTVVSHPPYSPYLAPSDFFLFPKLKMKLKGRRFQTEEIQAESQAVLNTLRQNDF